MCSAREAAQKLAFAKRGGFDFVAMVARDDNETKIDSGPLVPAPAMYAAAPDTPAPANSASSPPDDKTVAGPPPTPPHGGCAGCRVGDGGNEMVPLGATIAAIVGMAVARVARRNNRRRKG